MYYSQLVRIVDYLNDQNFKTLTSIARVDQNIIELCFDRTYYVYFDMTKGAGTIFTMPHPAGSKNFQAAFDTMLQKRFGRANVTGIALVDADKVVRIDLETKGAYKLERRAVQFEFTGKYTNVILLDDKGIVLEALRHIDARNSSRVVRPGEILAPVPKGNFIFKEYPIVDVQAFLADNYTSKHKGVLETLKKVRIAQLDKQLHKLLKERTKLLTPDILEAQAQDYFKQAEVVLANIYAIKPYQTKLELTDFEGQALTVTLEKVYEKPSDMAHELFTKAKKQRKKAQHLHIEEQNLDARIAFTSQLRQLIEAATTQEAIETLLPKQVKQRKKEPPKPYEVFWIEDRKVLLGRHAKANQALLEDCKANDVWFHLKDRPSAHVVIVSDKQKIAPSLLEKAARLCVDFSVTSPGRYSVDYTKRKEVHLQEGANVLYYNYETLLIDKA